MALTNYHVIEGASSITVVVNDSSTYIGVLLGVDPLRDLAVVRICCSEDFQALPFGDASEVQAGDEVIATGYALGIEGPATVTRGIVSAIRYESNNDRWGDWDYGFMLRDSDVNVFYSVIISSNGWWHHYVRTGTDEGEKLAGQWSSAIDTSANGSNSLKIIVMGNHA